MSEPGHVRLRKQVRHVTNALLAWTMPSRASVDVISHEHVRKILVVRVNYRIGNILFTTPLLNALRHAFPDAQLDVVIGTRVCVPVLEGVPGVGQVYCCPRRILRQPLALMAMRRKLNNEHYDVIITPSLVSTSDKLVALLVRAPHKLGFEQPGTFTPATRTVPQPIHVAHEALKPLELLALLGVNIPACCRQLDVRLSREELAEGALRVPRHAVGIFRGARHDKRLPTSWWRSLLDSLSRLDDRIEFVEIVDPEQPDRLSPSIPAIWEPNLRTLAAILGNFSAFISGDTGIMHLASAADTPTIGLFKATAPRKFGPLGCRDLALVIREKPVELVARELLQHIHALEPAPGPVLPSPATGRIPIAYRDA